MQNQLLFESVVCFLWTDLFYMMCVELQPFPLWGFISVKMQLEKEVKWNRAAIWTLSSLSCWDTCPLLVVILTFTMASLVCDISDITPSVMMRSTKYCEPSWTAAAYLQRQEKQKQYILQDIWFFFTLHILLTTFLFPWLTNAMFTSAMFCSVCLNKYFLPPTLSQSLRRCIMLQFRKSNSNLRKMAFLITTVQ